MWPIDSSESTAEITNNCDVPSRRATGEMSRKDPEGLAAGEL